MKKNKGTLQGESLVAVKDWKSKMRSIDSTDWCDRSLSDQIDFCKAVSKGSWKGSIKTEIRRLGDLYDIYSPPSIHRITSVIDKDTATKWEPRQSGVGNRIQKVFASNGSTLWYSEETLDEAPLDASGNAVW